MKSIYAAAFALLISGSLTAQEQVNPSGLIPVPPISKKEMYQGMPKATTTTYFIDNEAADEEAFGSMQSYIAWTHYYKQFNGGRRWITQTFDSLLMTEDYTSGFYPMSYNNVHEMVIDSVFVAIHHQNHTGLEDTIIVSIVELTGQGSTDYSSFRPTDNVMWAETLITTTSLTDPPSATGYPIEILGFEPNFTLPSNHLRFGVKLEFRAPLGDSLAFRFSFPHDPNIPCTPGGTSQPHGTPILSQFYPSAFYQAFTSSGQNLYPLTSGNGYWYLNCDNDNPPAPDWPEENMYQDYTIWVQTTITDNFSVNENGSGLTELSSVPNPAKNSTSINYTLQQSADVSVSLVDVTGKIVASFNEGSRQPGKYSLQVDLSKLPAGLYYYTLNANNSMTTKKLVVVK